MWLKVLELNRAVAKAAAESAEGGGDVTKSGGGKPLKDRVKPRDQGQIQDVAWVRFDMYNMRVEQCVEVWFGARFNAIIGKFCQKFEQRLAEEEFE